MMRLISISFSFALLVCVSGATAAPATAPTTALAMEMLDEGRVRISPPLGWRLEVKSEDDRIARYLSPDDIGNIIVAVTPQESVMTKSVAPRLAASVAKNIRENVEQRGDELVMGPRAEPDERFLLKIHDRIRREGKVYDRVQIYRVMETLLLHVSASATTDSPEAAQAIHALGEKLADEARTGRGPTPLSFIRTRIKLTAPPDWKQQRRDDPNGIVATFIPPEQTPNVQLIVRSRVLPKPARTDEKRRDWLIDEMAEAELDNPPVEKATRQGEPQRVAGDRFLRVVKTDLESEGQSLQTVTRYQVMGDVIIAVTSVAPTEHAESIHKLGENMALSLKPLGE